MPLHAWIIYNGNLGDKFLTHAEIFQESARAHGIEAEVIPNHHLFSMVANGPARIVNADKHKAPDFILFWDKDIYLATQLEQLGYRIFNRANTIATCDDKCKTYISLGQSDVHMPKTIVAPKVFAYSGVRHMDTYDAVIEQLGLPFIIKEAYGSFGSQVYLIETVEQLREKVAELGSIPFLFQEYIESSHGTDLRLQVVGNEVVAAMRRVSTNDFRANMGKGATAYAHQPTAAESELAVRCAQLLGADFAGVDLLFGPDGEPMLCEVNSNAHIINLRNCTGVNAADPMMAHMKAVVMGQRK